MKKNICMVTATRAEWGLLRPLAHLIKNDDAYKLTLAVTGTHFLKEFGETYKEILSDGLTIDERIDILSEAAHSGKDVSVIMANAISKFADFFSQNKFELIILLGDRYETLAIAIAAMNAKIPILHLYGGEITEGAIDDAIRHAISKLSYLHCTSCENYRNRVIQLGESPERVYNTGAIGIDNIRKMHLLSKEKLSKELNFDLISSSYALVTFHPETLNTIDIHSQCSELLSALSTLNTMKFIITKSNADEGAEIINKMMDEYANRHKNVLVVSSLGNRRYLSALKYASVMIGNSSSGLSEAPYFKVPTVNIGIRQKGRIQTDSVINCQIKKEDIIQAINTALSEEFKKDRENTVYPFGDGHAAEKILTVIHKWLDDGIINLKKVFYDL